MDGLPAWARGDDDPEPRVPRGGGESAEVDSEELSEILRKQDVNDLFMYGWTIIWSGWRRIIWFGLQIDLSNSPGFAIVLFGLVIMYGKTKLRPVAAWTNVTYGGKII
jgi:hypothetical protein